MYHLTAVAIKLHVVLRTVTLFISRYVNYRPQKCSSCEIKMIILYRQFIAAFVHFIVTDHHQWAFYDLHKNVRQMEALKLFCDSLMR